MKLLVAFALLAGVAHADDELDIAGRDATDLAGDAMVWEDAAFHLEPWDGGAMIRFSSLGVRRDSVGRALPVKIVSAAMRGFVEVEVVDAETCTWRRTQTDYRISGLRLFVRREDLAPVLVKPFTITYPNGTRARVQAGVPVMPTSSGAYLISARGDIVRLPIPHASVGFTYTRGRVDDPKPPKGPTWKLERTTKVKLGDGDFDVRHSWRAPRPVKRGDMSNLKWTTRCIELVVAAPTKNVVSYKELGSGGGSGVGYGVGAMRHMIPRGTPLSTFGGREVAIAAEEIEVYPPANGKACFDARLAMIRDDDVPPGRIERTFRLCANADAVEGPPVDTVAKQVDPYAAPDDVGAAPSDAKRTIAGVFYRRLVTGKSGRKPSAGDTVVVHYTGWTTDGRMFDSSLKRGQPARFSLRSVIPGWTDGLQVMAVGDKVRFWIPEELAYKGVHGRPAGMLVFDVELLGID
jgi:hypothetical protein